MWFFRFIFSEGGVCFQGPGVSYNLEIDNDWWSGSPGKVRLLPWLPLLCYVFFVIIFIVQVILHFYNQINDAKEHDEMRRLFVCLE